MRKHSFIVVGAQVPIIRPTANEGSSESPRKRTGAIFLSVLVLGTVVCAAAQTYTISPTMLAFGNQTVGFYTQHTVQVTNTGSTNVTVNSLALIGKQFHLVNGWAPATISPGKTVFYTLQFVPDSAQSFNGSITLTVQSTPTVVPLSGTGTATAAEARLSASSLSFNDVVQGTSSTSQTVTVTNTGSSMFTLLTVNADPPFAVTGFTKSIAVKAGASVNLGVTLFGTNPGNYTGELSMTFDVLQPQGVTLTGRVTPPNKLAVTTFAQLPSGAVTSPYLGYLTAAGGSPPYTWNVAKGSQLPSGLSLRANGQITGTLASGIGVGTYSFRVQTTDVNDQSATAVLSLPVGPLPTGSNGPNCSSIYYPNLTSPLTPLTDLGTGTYLGQQGGLYAGGSNSRPSGHDSAGVSIANNIQPLNANGNPDPNGKMALLGLGMSESRGEFNQFAQDATADPSTSPQLVFVNGAQDATLAGTWANPTSSQWITVLDFVIPQDNVTANQVVAAWVRDIDEEVGTFPSDAVPTQTDLETIAQTLHTYFPNLKLVYFSSRIYGGYSNGLKGQVNGEPHAYESGFSVKWAIADQINGDLALNYNAQLGPVMAPWMAWGPYDWANGLLPRSDGLTWSCQQFQDGVHPSKTAGQENDANQLLNFFKTDTTTTPWFLRQ
jgi:Abnormal spindle-like microcephaly-assoc'd, ASPM-SPD-2-Hydin